MRMGGLGGEGKVNEGTTESEIVNCECYANVRAGGPLAFACPYTCY